MDAYHVRFSKEEDSKGPFDLDALQTLAESGKLTAASLVFDTTTSRWYPLATFPELQDRLFQKRKGLTLRKGEPIPLNREPDAQRPPSVDQRLTRESLNPEIARRLEAKQRLERLAALSIPLLCLFLALSAFSLLAIPLAETLSQYARTHRIDATRFLKPAPGIGLIDGALALLLFLKAVPGRWVLVARAVPGSACLASLPFLGPIGTQPLDLLLSVSAIAFGTGILLLALIPRPRILYPAAGLASAGLFVPLALTLADLWKFVS